MSKAYMMTDEQYATFENAKTAFDAGKITFDANPYKLCAGEYPFVFKGETYLTVFNRHTSDLELYHFASDSMKNYSDTMEVRLGA